MQVSAFGVEPTGPPRSVTTIVVPSGDQGRVGATFRPGTVATN